MEIGIKHIKIKIMKKIINFLKSLQFIFKPSYWIMNDKYDPFIDELILGCLKRYKFVKIDKYTAKLGPIILWTDNRPYGAIRLYPDCLLSVRKDTKNKYGRPSRLTIKKSLKELEKVEKELSLMVKHKYNIL